MSATDPSSAAPRRSPSGGLRRSACALAALVCAVAAVVVWLTAASTERLAPLAEGTPPFDATVYSGAAIGGSVALATLAALFVVAVVSTRPRTRPADRAEFSPAGR